MSISYKEGCLIQGFKKGEVQAIAHQANCFNTMGSGVAKAIRAQWPEVYEADCQTVKGDREKLGTLSWCPVITDGRRKDGHGPVFNLYGQYDFGYDGKQYTDLDALESAMAQMSMFCAAMDITKVGMPKLGCDRGGAKWEDVEAIIERQLGHLDVTIYIK